MSPAARRRPTTMTTRTAVLTGVSTVAIPVSDQDRTKALFEELGFETRFDADLGGGFRWIDMATVGGGTSISVIKGSEELPTGIDTGIRFVTADARAARAHLLALGLSVGELLDWPTAPLMFTFCDFDENRLYVAEPT